MANTTRQQVELTDNDLALIKKYKLDEYRLQNDATPLEYFRRPLVFIFQIGVYSVSTKVYFRGGQNYPKTAILAYSYNNNMYEILIDSWSGCYIRRLH